MMFHKTEKTETCRGNVPQHKSYSPEPQWRSS